MKALHFFKTLRNNTLEKLGIQRTVRHDICL